MSFWSWLASPSYTSNLSVPVFGCLVAMFSEIQRESINLFSEPLGGINISYASALRHCSGPAILGGRTWAARSLLPAVLQICMHRCCSLRFLWVLCHINDMISSHRWSTFKRWDPSKRLSFFNRKFLSIVYLGTVRNVPLLSGDEIPRDDQVQHAF